MIKATDPKNEFKKSSFEPAVTQKETHLQVNTIKSKPWTATLDLNGSDVDFKLDSGAEINVLPKSVYNNLLKRPKFKSTNIKLSAYNNTDIPVLGKCIASITYKNSVNPILFVVADTDSTAVLGATTCDKLQLIKRLYKIDASLPQFLDQYEACFGEIGTFQPRITSQLIEMCRLLCILLEKFHWHCVTNSKLKSIASLALAAFFLSQSLLNGQTP